jgi:DHA1 family multidrug resistance protein-like MFS transporter/DHA1 family quinolone resistance protein-like MFS transporter
MNKILVLVYTIACSVGITYGASAPLVPVFAKQELVATYFDIGMIGMANYVPYMFAPALVGLLLDRFNKGSILSIGIAVGMFSTFLLAFTNDVVDVMLVRALTGIAHAFLWPPAEAVVAMATSPEKRVQAISKFTMAWVAGYMAGPLIGATLFEAVGFRSLFEYSSAIMIVALAAALILIKHGKGAYHEKYSITDVFTIIKINPKISTLVMYYSAAFGIVLTIFPAYLKDNAINEFSIGILFFIFGLSRLFTLPFTHKFGTHERVSIFAATQAIAFAMLIAYAFTTFGFFSLSLIMFGFAFSLYFPITLSLITKNVPGRMVGTSVGAYETVFGTGWAIGPIISGIAADAFGSSMPYIAMFIIGVILPVMILSKRKARKEI